MPNLLFKDAVKARDEIAVSEQLEIARLYDEWADELAYRAKYYERKEASSYSLKARQLNELSNLMRKASDEVYKEIESGIKKSIYATSVAMVDSNARWLESLGFSAKGINATFSNVPDFVVKNLINGNIYESGWSLSGKIWSDNQKTLKDIYSIVAKGRAMNMPVYDITKQLEQYVRPGANKKWQGNVKYLKRNPDGSPVIGSDGKPVYESGPRIFKKTVDYNAQRLARTLIQHSYQQTFIAVTKDNPFIEGYIWRSTGSRACEECLARDGEFYTKEDLPMDHPNGMCVMEPATDPNMIDRLANWINSPEGTYPEIDKFAENFR